MAASTPPTGCSFLSDIVARIGGDEFIVIPVGKIGDDIQKITDRLEKKRDAYNSEKKLKYRLSLSMGIAFYDPEHPCSAEELPNQGDKQMYKRKQAKKPLTEISFLAVIRSEWRVLFVYTSAHLVENLMRISDSYTCLTS